VFPQETAPPDKPELLRLSPGEAVELAIKNNLSLESARIASGTKKRASDLSWNQFIPSVTVGGNLIRQNEEPKAMEFDLGAVGMPGVSGKIPLSPAAPQWNVAGSIQASLTLSAAMFENMRRLRLDYQGGLISYEKARLQLERDVLKSYNNMLLLRENIALLRDNFEAAGRRVRTAQANYNAGLAPELTLLQARVAMETMKPSLDQAENGLRLSMAQFAMFLGKPYNTEFELEPFTGETAFISLDLADLISKAASGKPDIMALRQDILMLRSTRRAQIAALTPSLTLSWNSNAAFVKDPWENPWFDSKDDWQKSGSLTISLGLRLHSLIPFSQDFQGIRDLDDNIKTANIGLAQLVQGTEIEIYNTVLSLEKTQTTAEAQTQTVNLAERSYRLTEQAYRAGLQDLLEVQNAELSLRQARVQMLEQQFNYLNGLIDLEYSIGVPFGTLNKKGANNEN
jgi:outer membrane protein TolC